MSTAFGFCGKFSTTCPIEVSFASSNHELIPSSTLRILHYMVRGGLALPLWSLELQTPWIRS